MITPHRETWRILSRCLVAAVALTVVGLRGSEALADATEPVEKEQSAGQPAEFLDGANSSQREIWKAFVEHLRSAGKGDLVPAPTGETSDGHGQEGDRQEGDGQERDDRERDVSGAKDGIHYPDFSRGDPIRGVLFRLSNDLVNLDALFLDSEKKRLDPEKREKKIAKLLGRLKKEKDPYLRDYALYYQACQEMERGQDAKATRTLEKLVSSPRFLSGTDARRSLVKAYRRQGEETLAILELQFYLLGLDPHDAQNQLWAESQLEAIRENHDGPMHDVADRARTISTSITLKGLGGGGTLKEQRKVEDILTKVAKLLEEKANACPLCAKNASHCKAQAKQGKPCKSGKCASSGACKACGKGMKLAKGQGDPRGDKPTGPAQDSVLRRGELGEVHLRDRESSRAEAWGMINDREVARALREAWSKIPVAYQQLVASYFKDISDLEPAPEKEKSKKKKK